MAASAGGVAALRELLSVLPSTLPVPVMVVQHLSRTSQLVEVLRPRSGPKVQWASDAVCLQPGTVYVAPPQRHLVLQRKRLGVLRDGPRVNHTCPAADPLFISAAKHYGPRTLAVVLSGLLNDGAAGAAAIRAAGGTVIVQDPASCLAPGMPYAALRATQSRLLLPPRAIGHAITILTMMPGAATLLGVAAPPPPPPGASREMSERLTTRM